MSPEGLYSRLANVEAILPDLIDMYELRAAGGPYHWATLNRDQTIYLWGELDEFVAWPDGRYLTNMADPAPGYPPAGTVTPSRSRN